MKPALTIPYPIPSDFVMPLDSKGAHCSACGGEFRSGNVTEVEDGVVLTIWKNMTPHRAPCDHVFVPTNYIPTVIKMLGDFVKK